MPEQRERSDEDVQRIEIQRERCVDGVVHRGRDAHRTVHVEDDQRREDGDASPVEERDRASDRQADPPTEAGEQHADDQHPDSADEPGVPALETPGDDRSDDAQHGDQRQRAEGDDEHARRRVHGDDRPQQHAERPRSEREAERRDDRVVTPRRDEHTGERRDDERDRHEPADRPPEGEPCGQRRDADAHEGREHVDHVERPARDIIPTHAVPDT